MFDAITNGGHGISDEIRRKYVNLQNILKDLKRVLVAYSGGVDSTFLLKVAQDVLGDDVLAVIASSETYPEKEQKEALSIAEGLKVRYRVIHTKELDNPDFKDNPPERCYFCKRELFSRLKEIADKENIPHICDGSNLDDTNDFRPGSRAAKEFNVHSPLQEARLRKGDIRILSKNLGLSTWDKPAMACLSSRIPYFTPIEKESLRQVDSAEEYLRSKGFSQIRVRHHGQTARIEIDPKDFSLVMEKQTREEIVDNLKKIGYLYVTLDLAGYRTGSMNEPIMSEKAAGQKKTDDRT